MKKLLCLLTLFVLTISVKAQISIDSAKAMLARAPYHVIGGGLQIIVKDTCQHIWVDVVSDTVTNHKPPLLTYPIGLPPPKEWQNGNEIVCLLCKNKKIKVIHNVGYNNFYDDGWQFKNGVMLLDTLETYSHIDSAVRKKIKDASPLIKYK